MAPHEHTSGDQLLRIGIDTAIAGLQRASPRFTNGCWIPIGVHVHRDATDAQDLVGYQLFPAVFSGVPGAWVPPLRYLGGRWYSRSYQNRLPHIAQKNQAKSQQKRWFWLFGDLRVIGSRLAATRCKRRLSENMATRNRKSWPHSCKIFSRNKIRSACRGSR
jgi:hypothetical protein